MNDLNQLTGSVIGAAIEVHKNLGPGLLESSLKRGIQGEFLVSTASRDSRSDHTSKLRSEETGGK